MSVKSRHLKLEIQRGNTRRVILKRDPTGPECVLNSDISVCKVSNKHFLDHTRGHMASLQNSLESVLVSYTILESRTRPLGKQFRPYRDVRVSNPPEGGILNPAGGHLSCMVNI